MTDQQIDEINKLKIPQIIKRGFTVSGILVDRVAGELIAGIKDRLPGYLHGGVDLARNAVKSLIEAKLGNPTTELLDATRISNDIYAFNAIVSIPIRLAEIPGLSAAQVAIGDITFFIDITISGEVDILSQTVSQIDYRDVMIRV